MLPLLRFEVFQSNKNESMDAVSFQDVSNPCGPVFVVSLYHDRRVLCSELESGDEVRQMLVEYAEYLVGLLLVHVFQSQLLFLRRHPKLFL
jgi:hypothetical protein